LRTGPGEQLGGWATLLVLLIAAVLRLAFLIWAPDALYGDPQFYYFYGTQIAQGAGFTENDGSPAIFWMPGWPLLLGGVFAVFGESVAAGLVLNALLGTATAGLVGALGAALLGWRAGLIAGLLYAVWPGNILLGAVLFAETAFNFFLVLALWLQVRALHGDAGAPGTFAAGLAFGGAALVKAEPLVLVPVLVAHLWLCAPAGRQRRLVLAWLGALVVALAPWVVRNEIRLDRPLVTSASGGTNFWIGNHHGASGGNDLVVEALYRELNARETYAGTNLAQNEAGWRDGLAFVRRHPGEALALLPKKLWLTYTSDAAAAGNLRPLAPVVRLRLERVANGFWAGVLALALVGLAPARRWPLPTRVLVLGLPLSWVVVHLGFVGGPRFHAPETPALALLAAAAIDAGLRRVVGQWPGPVRT